MLEIMLIYGMCSGMGSLLRDKGRNPLGFQILLVLGWFFGEVAGFIVGMAATNSDQPGFESYVFALIGAACAAGLTFLVAALVPPAAKPVTPAAPTFKYG